MEESVVASNLSKSWSQNWYQNLMLAVSLGIDVGGTYHLVLLAWPDVGGIIWYCLPYTYHFVVSCGIVGLMLVVSFWLCTGTVRGPVGTPKALSPSTLQVQDSASLLGHHAVAGSNLTLLN